MDDRRFIPAPAAWDLRDGDVLLFVSSFVRLSVCPPNAYTQKLSNWELWSLLTTNGLFTFQIIRFWTPAMTLNTDFKVIFQSTDDGGGLPCRAIGGDISCYYYCYHRTVWESFCTRHGCDGRWCRPANEWNIAMCHAVWIYGNKLILISHVPLR